MADDTFSQEMKKDTNGFSRGDLSETLFAVRAARQFADEHGAELKSPAARKHALKTSQAAQSSAANKTFNNVPALHNYGLLYGDSQPMRALYSLIERVAPTEASVLIHGESGTGKDLVAQTIHKNSRRADKPFVAVNCGALPASMIEAELFGHERGSFTGANRDHRGCFERASSGTLFLDEITELPLEMQCKLLRALESGKFFRVGGEVEIKTDVRVIAASNRDPRKAIREGKFREDLWYRLAQFPVMVPPLRERGEDIVGLAQLFLDQINQAQIRDDQNNDATRTDKRFSAEAKKYLRTNHWSGNVRELKHAVQRAAILSDDILEFNEAIEVNLETNERESGEIIVASVGMSIYEIERSAIEKTLEHFNQDKRITAEVLGVSLKTLYNRINEYRRIDSAARRASTGESSAANSNHGVASSRLA